MKRIMTMSLLLAITSKPLLADSLEIQKRCGQAIKKMGNIAFEIELLFRPTRKSESKPKAKLSIPISIPGPSKAGSGPSTSSPASNSPPKAPKPIGQFQAKNFNTDPEPDPNQKVQVLASVPKPNIERFYAQRLQRVDPISGTWYQAPIAPRAQHSKNPELILTQAIDRPGEWQGLWVPEGYYPLARNEAQLQVKQDRFGHFWMKANGKTAEIPLATEGDEALTEEDISLYTTTAVIDESALPTWLRDEIQILAKRISSEGLSNLQIAEVITKLIRTKMIYQVDESHEVGIYAMLAQGKCQCSGAATIAASILRSRFKIPTRFVAGRISYSDRLEPGLSVVKDPDQDHAWIEIYDSKLKKWIALDPTPTKTDRKKKNETPDPRFTRNGSQQENEEQEDTKAKDEPDSTNKGLSSEEKIWLKALENYESQEKLAHSIETALQSPSLPLEFKNRGRKLLDELSDPEKGYQSLDSLANELNTLSLNPENAPQLLKKMKGLFDVLTEISSLRDLNNAERTVHEHLTSILDQSTPEEPSAEAIGRWLMDQMIGPLSQAELERLYYDSKTRIWNWGKLKADLKAGKLDHFLQQLMMKSYLNLWMQRQSIARDDFDFSKQTVPISDLEPRLDRADENFDPRFVLRDGPQNLDLIRAQSGDLSVWKFPEEEIRAGREYLRPQYLSFILLDMSGSMNLGDERYLWRNALELAFLDESQRIVARRWGTHYVTIIPYEDLPWPNPTEITTLEEAHRYYRMRLADPKTGYNGNNLSNAMKLAFEMAGEQELKFQKINILGVTDGQETVNLTAIRNARSKVPPNVSVWFNSVTIIEGNSEIEKLGLESRNGDLPPTGFVTSHHLSATHIEGMKKEIAKLRDPKGIIDLSSKSLSEQPRRVLRDLAGGLRQMAGRRQP